MGERDTLCLLHTFWFAWHAYPVKDEGKGREEEASLVLGDLPEIAESRRRKREEERERERERVGHVHVVSRRCQLHHQDHFLLSFFAANHSYPTNSAHLINFQLSSDAEIFVSKHANRRQTGKNVSAICN